MSEPKRATVALQYRIMLIGPDGAEWEWRITDSYWWRRLKKIGREMLEIVREHDLSYEFGLQEQEQPVFKKCEHCGATSVGDRERHKTNCSRPQKGD